MAASEVSLQWQVVLLHAALLNLFQFDASCNMSIVLLGWCVLVRAVHSWNLELGRRHEFHVTKLSVCGSSLSRSVFVSFCVCVFGVCVFGLWVSLFLCVLVFVLCCLVVGLWLCCVVFWLCGCVALWLCGCVAVWLCVSVALWLCGSVALWLCGCVAVPTH